MKFRIYGVVLSLFFALGLVFSFSVDASANHGDGTGIDAADVVATDEASVKKFLNHIIDFYNQQYNINDSLAEQNTKVTVYGRAIREEGVYNSPGKNMYSIGINENEIVTNHAGHHGLYGYRFNRAADSATATTLKALLDDEDLEIGSDPVCENYGPNDERAACATQVDSPSGTVTVIAGLHHEKDDTAFDFPDCTSLGSIDTPATQVNDRDSLKLYVEGVIALSKRLLILVGRELFMENPELFGRITAGTATPEDRIKVAKLTPGKLSEKVACFGNDDPDKGPVLKHGEIYGFVMNTDQAATVLVNALNPSLNGLDLQVTDPNPNPITKEANTNIAELIRDAVFDAQGDPKEEGEFVEYHWLKPGDTAIDNWFEQKVVPGNSHKITYVRAANISPPNNPRAVYIFGSGIYPTDMMPETPTAESGSGGGCAIAGTSNRSSQISLLNLFLVASVLFPTVFLRRCV